MIDNIRLATRLIEQARAEWLEANDPQDGTDVVTPYDEWFYEDRTKGLGITAITGDFR